MLAKDLKVYKDTYELVLRVHQLVPKFPVSYRHTLGDSLCKHSLELFLPISAANRTSDCEERIQLLNKFQIVFETFDTELRLAKDLRIISLNQFANICEVLIRIGKQISGWKKATR